MFNKNFWKNKSILITGDTGFSGTWLTTYLKYLGAKNLYGISIKDQKRSLLTKDIKEKKIIDTRILNIQNFHKLETEISKIQPDIIIHLAAQSLVLDSYETPYENFKTNVLGTLNLLEIFKRQKKIKMFLNVTTDKVYDNKLKKLLSEKDKLDGEDPYSSSKVCSEIISKTYEKNFFRESKRSFSVVRAGNILGGGDWNNRRLIPDLIKSLIKKNKIIIRNKNATRPWQHILDALTYYLKIIEFNYDNYKRNDIFNIGPYKTKQVSVEKIVQIFSQRYNYDLVSFNKQKSIKENLYLSLDSSKVRRKLNFRPKLDSLTTLDLTFDWYDSYLNGNSPYEITLKQISQYNLNNDI